MVTAVKRGEVGVGCEPVAFAGGLGEKDLDA